MFGTPIQADPQISTSTLHNFQRLMTKAIGVISWDIGSQNMVITTNLLFSIGQLGSGLLSRAGRQISTAAGGQGNAGHATSSSRSFFHSISGMTEVSSMNDMADVEEYDQETQGLTR